MTFEESQRRAMLDTGRSSWRADISAELDRVKQQYPATLAYLAAHPTYAREQSALEEWKRERRINEAHARLTEYAKRGQIGPVDDDRPDPLGR